jgi:hypothetical protein
MPDPRWHFRPMQRGEINVDPVHDEFFKAQDLVDALVRESIQNSLDARRGNARVRVRFALHTGPTAQTTEVAMRYFEGLYEHLEAVRDEVPTPMPRWNEPLSYLVVEDFGTRGLCGDPEEEPDLELSHREKNDFYYFWRNVGRGVKSEKDRGRWGLGKAVFSFSSRIRTIFGLTHRAEDGRRLLLGQSVLRIHSMDGRKHAPYGFFGRFKGELPLPVEDASFLERFEDDFRLTRSEPGLSIVIPWFREGDFELEKLIQSVLRQYFYPITRADLTVDVEAGPLRESISAKTIDAIAKRYPDKKQTSSARVCELTRWAIMLDPKDVVEIREPHPDRAPAWNEHFVSERLAEALRTRLEAGQRVALRAPVTVKRKGRKAATFFHLYLEKDDSLRRGEHHFIRRGITIPDIRSDRAKPVRALLVVDDDALSALLGDSENPAHSDWSERADKVKANYEHGAYTVRYVKNAIEYISSILLRPPQSAVRDLLKGYFSFSAPEAGKKPGPEPKPGTDEDKPEIPTPPREVRIQPSRGGFVLRGDGKSFTRTRYCVAAAYRVRHGDPFNKYHPFDFVIGENGVQAEARSIEVLKVENNTLEFEPTAADYRLHLTGFDPRRDLVVKIEERPLDAT